MKEAFVIDPLISKRQQLLLATQLCRMVLKVRLFSFLYCIVRLIQQHMYQPIPFPSVLPSSREMPGKRGGVLACYTRQTLCISYHARLQHVSALPSTSCILELADAVLRY